MSNKTRQAERALLALASVVIAGSVLAMGSIDTPVLVVVACAAAVACFGVWAFSSPIVCRGGASLILAAGAGLTLLTLLQCIPLPMALLRVLSPHAAETWSMTLRPLREAGPTWAPLTLDPTATRIQVLRGVTYLLVFLTIVRLGRRPHAALTIERAVVVSSVLVALLALGHDAFGFHAVYGFYRPHREVTAIAPLMNLNNLAAYVNLGIVISFAALFAREPFAPKSAAAVIVVFLLGTNIWIASRGGLASVVVGLVVVTILAMPTFRVPRLLVPTAVSAGGVALMIFASTEHTVHHLARTDYSKLSVARRVLTAMVPAYPFFGSGRGTFESTFPEFRTGGGYVVWTHAENLVAQWLAEWGLPATLLALTALTLAFRPSSLTNRSRTPIGPYVAVLVVALHNLVDYSLEIPGVTIAVAACAGLVVAGTGSSAPRWFGRWSVHPRALARTSAIVTLVAIGVVLLRGGELLSDEERVHAAVARSTTNDPEHVEGQVRRAMLDHPAEPYFALLGAVHALDSNRSVTPWIAKTLERSPVYPPAHLVLARALRRASPSQARLEYRLYQEQGQIVDPTEVLLLVGSYDDAVELAVAGPSGATLLEQIAVRVANRLPATRVRIDEESLLRDPSALGATLRLATDRVADLEEDAVCPDKPSCAHAAEVAVNRAQTLAPTKCAGYALSARVALDGGGDVDRALEGLRRATDAVDDRIVCLEELAKLATDARRPRVATEAIDLLSRAGCNIGTTCGSALLAASRLERSRGNKHRALELLRQAAAAGNDDATQAEFAATAATFGLHAEAAGAYRRLATVHPEQPLYARRATEETALAAGMEAERP